MSNGESFKVWACTGGIECAGHKDDNHGRGRTIEARDAHRAAEEAGEELVGPFGDMEVRDLLEDGARVHVVAPDGTETTWSISARIACDAYAAEWRPWTATIQWLPEPLRSVATKARLFADMRKVIVLDGTTWITNGHVLARVAVAPPDDFERLPETSEAAIREMLQYGERLTEQRRITSERDGTVIEFHNGAEASAEYIDAIAGVFPDTQWFRSTYVDPRGAQRPQPDDPPFVAVSRGDVVGLVMSRVRQSRQG
jgi:hypothetical protein